MGGQRCGLLLAIALCAAGVGAAPTAPVRVSFDSLARDPAGRPVRLTALLYAPEPSGAPRPAVIALHGCGGLYVDTPAGADALTARHRAMAEMLVGEGYAVLLPDSFGPRGRREQCALPARDQRITPAVRRLDVLGALAWLRGRADVAGDRIALVGWSHGGSTTLAAMNAQDRVVAAFRDAREGAYFATAIAFYPGCSVYARARQTYTPAAPLAIMIGASDNWTPPAPCAVFAEAMVERGLPVSLRIYEGAVHGFDAPGARVVVRRDVTTGVYPGLGVSIGGNPAARADAYARLKAILRERIGGADRDPR